MITAISLNNFKAFSSLDSLKLKPITILTGKISSGKSSILHSLLLLKQSLTEEVPEDAIVLEGTYLQYTHLKELSFMLPQEASASVGYEFQLRSADNEFLGTIRFGVIIKSCV